jgi:predicted restriction endonuclease
MTAVEWLVQELGSYLPTSIKEVQSLIEQAKEIEKQQIIEARVKKPLESEWLEAEQYYNETFKKE